jgi:hypothetical protein
MTPVFSLFTIPAASRERFRPAALAQPADDALGTKARRETKGVQPMSTKNDSVPRRSLSIHIAGFFGWLQRLWEAVLDFWTVLKPCRFSLFMTLVGLGFLIFASQGLDALRGLVETYRYDLNYFTQQAFFVAAAALWAIYSWYFAGQLLTFRFPNSPPPPNSRPTKQDLRLRSFCFVIPRLLGTSCFLIVSAAHVIAAFAYHNAQRRHEYFWILLGLGAAYLICAVVFFLIATHRRDLQNRLYQSLAAPLLKGERARKVGVALFAPVPEDDQTFFVHTRLRDLAAGSWSWIGLSAAITLGLFFAFLFAPVGTGQFLGAATITLFAAAGWIVFGSALVYVGSRFRLPVFTLLIVAALIFSLWNDNHAVRTFAAAPAPRPTLKQRFGEWLGAMNAAYPERARHPLILVAAEGGGIRAAYWTATVLSELQDRNPQFAEHVFAISGVSGGSVGAGVFTALVAEQAEGRLGDCRYWRSNEGPRSMRHCAQRILSQDFLGPVVGAMLYPDLTQRFFPIAVPLADRGRALEGAWEAAWRGAFEKSNRFAEPMQQLWANPATTLRVPSLLLNSTRVERGNRVIASNIRIESGVFDDAVDLYDVIGNDLPLSAAVHNSARFTYVSPAGTLIAHDTGKAWGQVVDGGYFENSGGTTALEVLAALKSSPGWAKVLPVVISITNDPVPDNPPPATVLEQAQRDAFASETRAPIETLFNTRDARGLYARRKIEHDVVGDGGEFYVFELCKRDVPLPLGWELSRLAETEIQAQLGDRACHLNAAALQRLAQMVGTP